VRHLVEQRLCRRTCWPELPRTVTGKILRRQVVSDLLKGP
jgi:acyl-coenzyme A synthetase/AMP-(fatty) acid ligase